MSMPREPELFDFGLDFAQEERARALHEESIVIDLVFNGPCGPSVFTDEMAKQVMDEYERHHDAWRTLMRAQELPARMAMRGEFPQYREWWDASGVTAGSRDMGMMSFDDGIRILSSTIRQFDSFDWLIKALKAKDIRQAKAEGKHVGFITCQDTLPIGQNLDNLDLFYDLGLRVLQLTYNSMNFVGTGCTERTDTGISNFGVSVIERMNELGIVVDTGHCGRQTTLDAIALSHDSVIVSHSCAAALSGHPRGKSDEELQALAGCGGVIGIVTVPFFLTTEPDPTIERFLDHIDYIANLIGPEHIGIGTDWPNMLPEWGLRLLDQYSPELGFREEHRIDSTQTLKGFRDYREFPNITRGLVARGYSDEDIKGILGGNWLRVFQQVWK